MSDHHAGAGLLTGGFRLTGIQLTVSHLSSGERPVLGFRLTRATGRRVGAEGEEVHIDHPWQAAGFTAMDAEGKLRLLDAVYRTAAAQLVSDGAMQMQQAPPAFLQPVPEPLVVARLSVPESSSVLYRGGGRLALSLSYNRHPHFLLTTANLLTLFEEAGWVLLPVRMQRLHVGLRITCAVAAAGGSGSGACTFSRSRSDSRGGGSSGSSGSGSGSSSGSGSGVDVDLTDVPDDDGEGGEGAGSSSSSDAAAAAAVVVHPPPPAFMEAAIEAYRARAAGVAVNNQQHVAEQLRVLERMRGWATDAYTVHYLPHDALAAARTILGNQVTWRTRYVTQPCHTFLGAAHLPDDLLALDEAQAHAEVGVRHDYATHASSSLSSRVWVHPMLREATDVDAFVVVVFAPLADPHALAKAEEAAQALRDLEEEVVDEGQHALLLTGVDKLLRRLKEQRGDGARLAALQRRLGDVERHNAELATQLAAAHRALAAADSAAAKASAATADEVASLRAQLTAAQADQDDADADLERAKEELEAERVKVREERARAKDERAKVVAMGITVARQAAQLDVLKKDLAQQGPVLQLVRALAGLAEDAAPEEGDAEAEAEAAAAGYAVEVEAVALGSVTATATATATADAADAAAAAAAAPPPPRATAADAAPPAAALARLASRGYGRASPADAATLLTGSEQRCITTTARGECGPSSVATALALRVALTLADPATPDAVVTALVRAVVVASPDARAAVTLFPTRTILAILDPLDAVATGPVRAVLSDVPTQHEDNLRVLRTALAQVATLDGTDPVLNQWAHRLRAHMLAGMAARLDDAQWGDAVLAVMADMYARFATAGAVAAAAAAPAAADAATATAASDAIAATTDAASDPAATAAAAAAAAAPTAATAAPSSSSSISSNNRKRSLVVRDPEALRAEFLAAPRAQQVAWYRATAGEEGWWTEQTELTVLAQDLGLDLEVAALQRVARPDPANTGRQQGGFVLRRVQAAAPTALAPLQVLHTGNHWMALAPAADVAALTLPVAARALWGPGRTPVVAAAECAAALPNPFLLPRESERVAAAAAAAAAKRARRA